MVKLNSKGGDQHEKKIYETHRLKYVLLRSISLSRKSVWNLFQDAHPRVFDNNLRNIGGKLGFYIFT